MEMDLKKLLPNPIPSTSQDENFYFAIDVQLRKIVVVDSDYDKSRYMPLDPLPKEYLKVIGVEVREEDIVDDDSDRQIHCYDCDKSYIFLCKEHPNYRAQDRSHSTNISNGKSRAERTLPAFLSIKESNIPNAGLGVFTKADIPTGIVFGPYEGVLVEDPKSADHHGYAWEIRRTFGRAPAYIDGHDPEKSNWIRYVNNARYEKEQNLIAFQYNGQIYYRVFQPIDRDQELLVWYGNEYGNNLVHGINVSREETKQRIKKKSLGVKRHPFVKNT